MKFRKIVNVYEMLEKTPARLEKTDIVANLLKETPEKLVSIVIRLLLGETFPKWMDKKIGIGTQLLIKSISKVTGIKEKEINEWVREEGDVGKAVGRAVRNKKQVSFFAEELSVEEIYDTLNRIVEFEGIRSQEKKLTYLSKLFVSADEKEAIYLSRIILEKMRTGVGEGIIRDAIAKIYSVPSEKIDRAYSLVNDWGAVAKAAKNGTIDSLQIEPFRPIRVMLAQKVRNIEEGFSVVGKPCAMEYKYDGFRMQVHKVGEDVRIFTRRLDNVTEQFPFVRDSVRRNIEGDCIVEGETVGIRGDKYLPFQQISRRIKRKYNIEEMARKIPVILHLFDIVYLNGRSLLDTPFQKRREILERIVKEDEKLVLAKQIVTDSVEEGNIFYKEALNRGNEGIMMKNLNAPYQPGSRVGYMIKLKPILETLDLVIIGAEWGEGRRAHWLATFLLACKDEEGNFVPIGKVGTGITDEMFQELTDLLKDNIIYQKGKEVVLKPELVVEVGYEEIQRSPKYESGFALRFPRVLRIREDRGPDDIDTIDRIYEIYESRG
ncbi:MAG: ATP-dependent DNA ligase [Methanomicrobia archaeon]|nr:ATP-dependent DNA ligase [Methanomicrobia archaeon]